MLSLSLEKLSKLKPPYVFLDTTRKDRENKESLLFSKVVDVLRFNHNDSLDSFFEKIESYLKKGFWLAGCFCYEFGYYLEDALESLQEKNDFPLAWFLVTADPDRVELEDSLHQQNKNSLAKNFKANISKNDYIKKVEKIKCFLKDGFSYQVNFTFKINFDFLGNPVELYSSLRNSQPTPYTALVRLNKSESLLSFSPELFIRSDGKKIITRPMKGTIARGATSSKDKDKKRQLARSKKIKAENVMITDLLRNDLGKISTKITVPELFNVEKYRTLYQMTSTVEARLCKNKKLKDIFSSLFPCGSVTGAPKIETMKIIKKLEKEPRGIYTGAIGYINPKKQFCFNVAIRTAHIKESKGQLGVGGGILYDSQKEAEYREALLKSNFFTKINFSLKLIETMLWSKNKGFWLLDLHLARLKNSSDYFSFPFCQDEIKAGLEKKVKGKKKDIKISIFVDSKGKIDFFATKLKKTRQPVKIKINSQTIDSNDIFFYHKTTNRNFYNRERKKAQKEGFFETIFLNKFKEVTEGTITNIFLEKKKKLFTPPVSCGLLGGVLRKHLIKEKKAFEKKIYLKDLKEADKIYIGNSVRGLLEAEFRDDKGGALLACSRLSKKRA
ncbi:MAG: aminodeoxychorismate synthase component I [Candidatus Omnitrophica bacterium]|nr:aminodeoxychorismate synthase component I [Candidatus Omnitrophota bacterium]MCF7891938.1 aminodeoxychorismate synthase component I [Candidatus Omnitrophota bacterium]MCF7897443.1 aminodeoxychorismate synthase component I [Candidatus Omnitrophota bacterium]MCF7909379.1 aminodeoxychorismate synthase component I [Candidatus Omnitrophota bacterium]